MNIYVGEMYRLILIVGKRYGVMDVASLCTKILHLQLEENSLPPTQLPQNKQKEDISWTPLLWHLSKWEEDKESQLCCHK
jgi:hypothetical protein